MRKPKEIIADIAKTITDPESIKKLGEFEASQKEQEDHIAKLEADNVKLSEIARDAIMNGPVLQKDNQPPIPPAVPRQKSLEDEINEAILAKNKKE